MRKNDIHVILHICWKFRFCCCYCCSVNCQWPWILRLSVSHKRKQRKQKTYHINFEDGFIICNIFFSGIINFVTRMTSVFYKHFNLLYYFLQSPSNSNDYLKVIGYREEEGRIESSDSYLKRMESYMKLYAAIIQVPDSRFLYPSSQFPFTGCSACSIALKFDAFNVVCCLLSQTQVPGIQNPHGLKEGWAWLSRFLNNLPANRTTAVALHAFLKVLAYTIALI